MNTIDKFAYQNVVWRAVRCCCSPDKIYGFIKLDSELRKLHYSIDGDTGIIKVARLSNCKGGHHIDELAIYSNDRPIEFWRKFPGFLEVKENDHE